MAKIGKKLLVLQFEDPDFIGVQVKAYSTSLGRALEISGQAEAARKADSGTSQFQNLLSEFVAKLQSWNIDDDDGRPVPATREGLLSLDLNDAKYILVSWFDAIMSVDKSLGKGWTSGERSPEESIPMDASSLDLTSWPTPN
jgi:hypothetical protein